jgi:hypothetical protein
VDLQFRQFTSVVEQVTTLTKVSSQAKVSSQTFSTVYAIFRAALYPRKCTLLLAVCM